MPISVSICVFGFYRLMGCYYLIFIFRAHSLCAYTCKALVNIVLLCCLL